MIPNEPLDPVPCVDWVKEHSSQDSSFEDLDACARALRNVHEFLHGEMDESQADHIRQHLVACERCMDDYDIEAMISSLLKRCHPPVPASETLRVRVSQMHVSFVV